MAADMTPPSPALTRPARSEGQSTRSLQDLYRQSQSLSGSLQSMLASPQPAASPSVPASAPFQRTMSWASDLSQSEFLELGSRPTPPQAGRRALSTYGGRPASSVHSLDNHSATLGVLDVSDPWGNVFKDSSPYDCLFPPPMPSVDEDLPSPSPSFTHLSSAASEPGHRGSFTAENRRASSSSVVSMSELAYPERVALRKAREAAAAEQQANAPTGTNASKSKAGRTNSFYRSRSSSTPETSHLRGKAAPRSKLANVDNSEDDPAPQKEETPHKRRFMWLFSLKNSLKRSSASKQPSPRASASPSPQPPPAKDRQTASSSSTTTPIAAAMSSSSNTNNNKSPQSQMQGTASNARAPEPSPSTQTPPLSTSASSVRSSSVETHNEPGASDDRLGVDVRNATADDSSPATSNSGHSNNTTQQQQQPSPIKQRKSSAKGLAALYQKAGAEAQAAAVPSPSKNESKPSRFSQAFGRNKKSSTPKKDAPAAAAAAAAAAKSDNSAAEHFVAYPQEVPSSRQQEAAATASGKTDVAPQAPSAPVVSQSFSPETSIKSSLSPPMMSDLGLDTHASASLPTTSITAESASDDANTTIDAETFHLASETTPEQSTVTAASVAAPASAPEASMSREQILAQAKAAVFPSKQQQAARRSSVAPRQSTYSQEPVAAL